MFAPQPVFPPLITGEKPGDRRVIDRFFGVVDHQILLADISDISAVGIFGEQMVKGLVLARANIGGDRRIPFLAIGEDGIDIENHAAEIEQPMTHNIADRKISMRDGRHGNRCNSGAGNGGARRRWSAHFINLVAFGARARRRLSLRFDCASPPRSVDTGGGFVHQANPVSPQRRGARVVDWDGLENRCAFTGTVGSNPTLSAISGLRADLACAL